MPLDIHEIKPLKGQLSSNLFENESIGLPLTLFFTIEIPLEAFDSGHDYVEQPTSTSIVMEWIRFVDPGAGKPETDWKNLTGKEYEISYEEDTGEGSIYLGSEHCPFNSRIRFLSLSGRTFDIEITLTVDFNIDTIHLDDDGGFTIRTELDYTG